MKNDSEDPKEIKLLLLGESNVGKTSIFNRYIYIYIYIIKLLKILLHQLVLISRLKL